MEARGTYTLGKVMITEGFALWGGGILIFRTKEKASAMQRHLSIILNNRINRRCGGGGASYNISVMRRKNKNMIFHQISCFFFSSESFIFALRSKQHQEPNTNINNLSDDHYILYNE